MTIEIIETVTFKLSKNVSESTFFKAAKAAGNFIHAQQGFLSQTLSKSEDGNWLDYSVWSNMEDSLLASKALMADASIKPYMQAVDMSSIQVARYKTVTSKG